MNAFKAWLPFLGMVIAAVLFFLVAIPSCSLINERLDEQDAAETAAIDEHKAEVQASWNKDEYDDVR